MNIGFTCGDDVTHSPVMLELGKRMKITMAVKTGLSVKWHILGRSGSGEGEGRAREGAGGRLAPGLRRRGVDITRDGAGGQLLTRGS